MDKTLSLTCSKTKHLVGYSSMYTLLEVRNQLKVMCTNKVCHYLPAISTSDTNDLYVKLS